MILNSQHKRYTKIRFEMKNDGTSEDSGIQRIDPDGGRLWWPWTPSSTATSIEISERVNI
jgi:hypothetical protein